jgi:hypothetical protein
MAHSDREKMFSAMFLISQRKKVELKESLPKFVFCFSAIELHHRQIVFGELLENFES